MWFNLGPVSSWPKWSYTQHAITVSVFQSSYYIGSKFSRVGTSQWIRFANLLNILYMVDVILISLLLTHRPFVLHLNYVFAGWDVFNESLELQTRNLKVSRDTCFRFVSFQEIDLWTLYLGRGQNLFKILCYL